MQAGITEGAHLDLERAQNAAALGGGLEHGHLQVMQDYAEAQDESLILVTVFTAIDIAGIAAAPILVRAVRAGSVTDEAVEATADAAAAGTRADDTLQRYDGPR